MNQELSDRWAIVTKALGMGLEREVSEGAIQALRNRVEDVYVEFIGETGEEPERPDFSDAVFSELFGPDEVKSNGRPPEKITPDPSPDRQRKLKFPKTKPRSKKKSPKKKKPVKTKKKSAKKAKTKSAKRKPAKKRPVIKKKRRRR